MAITDGFDEISWSDCRDQGENRSGYVVVHSTLSSRRAIRVLGGSFCGGCSFDNAGADW